MSPQRIFLRYLSVTGATILGLFVLQQWALSALDVQWHEELKERPANPALQELRRKEQQQLEAAGIEAAMTKVAKSRTSYAAIAPKPSEDLSAMSGWVRRPGFAPYEPQVVQESTPAATPVPAGTGNK